MPVTIDGTAVSAITIDGTTVQEITMDGSVVWSATTYVDAFDDGDLAEYSHADSDSKTNWTEETTTVRSGSSAAYTGAYNQQISGQGGGLPHYPNQGDRVSWWVRTTDATQSQTGAFFAYTSGTQYYLRALWNGGSIDLNVESTSASAAVSWSADTWYQLVVEWDDGSTFGGAAGDMTGYVYDAAGRERASVGPLNDTTLDGTNSGWGIFSDVGTSATSYHDEATITNR